MAKTEMRRIKLGTLGTFRVSFQGFDKDMNWLCGVDVEFRNADGKWQTLHSLQFRDGVRLGYALNEMLHGENDRD